MTFWNKILRLKQESTEEKTKIKTDAAEDTEKVAEPPHAADFNVTGVLRQPHITEKTTKAAEENKYIFSVAMLANKVKIKRAVEDRYKVKVERVNIINMPGKERRRGKISGWKPGVKKAIITLKEGQKIEIQ